MSRRGPTLVAGAVLVAALVAGQALADGAGKGRQVTVAQGRFGHHSWSLEVQGRGNQRCSALTLDSPGESSAAGRCERDRRPPPLFRLLLGVSGDDATVQLYETKSRVHSMRLKIAHPRSDRPSHWTHVHNQRLTRRQAHRSGVSPYFRFAVLDSRGNLCVKRAVLFNREGDRIDNRRVLCKF